MVVWEGGGERGREVRGKKGWKGESVAAEIEGGDGKIARENGWSSSRWAEDRPREVDRQPAVFSPP
jgi:hypothetical protein